MRLHEQSLGTTSRPVAPRPDDQIRQQCHQKCHTAFLPSEEIQSLPRPQRTGQSSAIIYTLVVCCQLHDHDSLVYLRDAHTRLTALANQDNIAPPTPVRWHAPYPTGWNGVRYARSHGNVVTITTPHLRVCVRMSTTTTCQLCPRADTESHPYSPS